MSKQKVLYLFDWLTFDVFEEKFVEIRESVVEAGLADSVEVKVEFSDKMHSGAVITAVGSVDDLEKLQDEFGGAIMDEDYDPKKLAEKDF